VGRLSGAVLLILGFSLMQVAEAHAEKLNTQNPHDLIPRLGTRIRHTRLDCSHFVHDVYKRAHLPYPYASSEQLYEGIDAFQRVFDPMPGDLIVWRGHVGIITDPNGNRFVSALRSGVKTDDYLSRYWKSRGKPRFLRYVGNRVAEHQSRTLSQSTASSFGSGD
jgi:NlpC/P60 family protein